MLLCERERGKYYCVARKLQQGTLTCLRAYPHTQSAHKQDTTQQSVHNAVCCTHIERISLLGTEDALSSGHRPRSHLLKLLDHTSGHWTNQQETPDLDPWSAASGTR